MMVKASELQLGDIVKVFEGAYGTATVKQIKDNLITFFRPYVHTDDFSYTGGVLCYTGVEEFHSFANSEETYELLRKGDKLR